MTRDQVDELMRENGIVVVGEAIYILCNLVEAESAAAEREACAKFIEDEYVRQFEEPWRQNLAKTIRKMGQE